MDVEIGAGVVAYGRLSREDERDRATPLEEKIQLRKDILISLARFHNIPLTLHQIVFDTISGGLLEERPAFMDILDRCRRREIHTLIVFDVDRVTRDIGHWKQIENAFYKGEVRLVTARGAYHFTRDFDSAMLQISAVMGEKERRSFSFRLRATNEQKAKRGAPIAGGPAYGYVYNKAEKRFETREDQYPIVCEVFRRAAGEGSHAIAKVLNDRGVPGPGVGKRQDANPHWSAKTILDMLRNPFYCGWPAKRTETDREGARIELPRSRWIMAEERQTYPCPITLDQWDALQETVSARRTSDDRKALLTGLVHCPAGNRMHKAGARYECDCAVSGERHANMSVRAAGIEPAVVASVNEWLTTKPLAVFRAKTKPRAARETESAERSAALRSLREKEATMQELVARASFYHSLPGYGRERHAETLSVMGREVETLRARVAQLDARLALPVAAQIAPLIDQVVAAGGVAAMPHTMQRAIILLAVDRIQLDPRREINKQLRTFKIVFHPLIAGEPVEFRLQFVSARAASAPPGPALIASGG